jgi:hypothetical protein
VPGLGGAFEASVDNLRAAFGLTLGRLGSAGGALVLAGSGGGTRWVSSATTHTMRAND